MSSNRQLCRCSLRREDNNQLYECPNEVYYMITNPYIPYWYRFVCKQCKYIYSSLDNYIWEKLE